MNVREFYEVTEGNYDEAMGRLLSEKRIAKYLHKLPETGDAEGMNVAFAASNWEDAFRFSHNLKGIALNLSITSLAEAAGDLCDTVRHGAPSSDFNILLEKVNSIYNKVKSAVAELDEY